jgi:hypothetical protein
LAIVVDMPFGIDELEPLLRVTDFLEDNRKELLNEFKPEVQKYLVKRDYFKGAFRRKYNQMFDELVVKLIKAQIVSHFPGMTPEEITILTDTGFLKLITNDYFFEPENYG